MDLYEIGVASMKKEYIHIVVLMLVFHLSLFVWKALAPLNLSLSQPFEMKMATIGFLLTVKPLFFSHPFETQMVTGVYCLPSVVRRMDGVEQTGSRTALWLGPGLYKMPDKKHALLCVDTWSTEFVSWINTTIKIENNKMKTERKFCQSCGMPLADVNDYSTNVRTFNEYAS